MANETIDIREYKCRSCRTLVVDDHGIPYCDSCLRLLEDN